jgi:hypothetical protein
MTTTDDVTGRHHSIVCKAFTVRKPHKDIAA